MDPTTDIMRIVNSTIEGTKVGGRFNTIGMNQSTAKIYSNNSLLRVIIGPTPETGLSPGTRPARGLDGVTLVTDQFITQCNVFLCDNGVESAVILLQGPTRVSTKIDELTGTQTYVTLRHNLARVIKPGTVRIVNGVHVLIVTE